MRKNEGKGGQIEEGNIGGGTGMVCYEFKGGTGTASRRIIAGKQAYTVGVLVQANFGRRNQLMVSGVPVGGEIPGLMPELKSPAKSDGSIIKVTDSLAWLFSEALHFDFNKFSSFHKRFQSV